MRKVMRIAACVLATGAALAMSSAASASIVVYNFDVDSLQEVPPNASPGWGTGTVTLDTSTGFFSWNISYQDLISPTIAAHFHVAPVGVNGPVVVDIGPSGPLGGTSGTFVGSTTITMAQVNDVLAGLWYVNIHTQVFPGGEIRGQVVPAPAALALLGVAGLIGSRRRRN